MTLLSGADRDEGILALRRIVGILDARASLPRSSLFVGEAGVALVLALAARELGDDALWERSLDRFERVLAAPSRLPTFSGGFFGELWVGEMLAALGAEIDVEIDEALDARLAAPPHPEYDLLNGWSGIAVYALARRSPPRLAAVVDRLHQLARRDDHGATWFRTYEMLPDDTRPMFPRGHFSLGVDHGQAGVIGVLADVIASGADVPAAAPLVDDAVAWLLSRRRTIPGRTFPALVDPELGEVSGRPESPLFGDTGRESWSHGDLGIATALLAAARVRHRTDWAAHAIEIALASMAHTSPPELDWVDLCDGRAGLGYLYTCLYRATRDPRFADAARTRLRAAWAGTGEHLTSTVMTGIAGVGLATLAALNDRAAAWETALGVGAGALTPTV